MIIIQHDTDNDQDDDAIKGILNKDRFAFILSYSLQGLYIKHSPFT